MGNWTYLNISTPVRLERGFTGHACPPELQHRREHYEVFNLIDMNGRVYDPVIGRFLSPDPIIQSPDFTQSYNSYSYCLNNPLKYIDPSGYSAYNDPWTEYNHVTIEEMMAGLFGGQYNDLLPFGSNFAGFGKPGQGRNGQGKYGLFYDYITDKWRSVDTFEEIDPFIASVILTKITAVQRTHGNLIIFNGKQVIWYNEFGEKLESYYAISGQNSLGIQNHLKENQDLKDYGPIPEGSYTINLSLNPERVAQQYENTNLFYNDVGILKVPNWMRTSPNNNPWGNIMARLKPTPGTELYGRDNAFYIHDSNKGYTSGCIEVTSSFFVRLLNYRKSHSFLEVLVFYY